MDLMASTFQSSIRPLKKAAKRLLTLARLPWFDGCFVRARNPLRCKKSSWEGLQESCEEGVERPQEAGKGRCCRHLCSSSKGVKNKCFFGWRRQSFLGNSMIPRNQSIWKILLLLKIDCVSSNHDGPFVPFWASKRVLETNPETNSKFANKMTCPTTQPGT